MKPKKDTREKQGKKKATRNAKQKADSQRKTLRRQSGEVRRVEVQFKADSERDQYAVHHMLNAVEFGSMSEFVRTAIDTEIAMRKIGNPAQQLNDMYQMLAHEFEVTPTVDYYERRFQALEDQNRLLLELVKDLKQEIQDLRDNPPHVSVQMAQAVSVTTTPQPPTLPESGAVASSGIDMSRPRPKPAKRVIDAPPTLPEQDLPDNWQVVFAKQMAESVKKAQPGRG